MFDDLRGLPPTLLLCGRDEVWRSDSERMARRLSDVGVAVELSVAEAMWHVWPLWGDFPESRTALGHVAVWLNRDRSDDEREATRRTSNEGRIRGDRDL